MGSSSENESAAGWLVILFFFAAGVGLRLLDSPGNIAAAIGGAMALVLTAGAIFAATNYIAKRVSKRPLRRSGFAWIFIGSWALLATAAGVSWIVKGAAALLGSLLIAIVALAQLYRGRRTALERAIAADPEIARWSLARSQRPKAHGRETY